VGSYHRWSEEGTVRHRQSKEARILWPHHEETRELPAARDNARNNARCMQARKTTHSLDGQHQDVDRTPCERVNQNDKRREINGESTSMVWPTLGSRTAKEQNSIACRAGSMELSGIASIICSSIWHLSVPLCSRHPPLWWVCCCGPSRQEISVDCCAACRCSVAAMPQHGVQRQVWAVPRCQLT